MIQISQTGDRCTDTPYLRRVFSAQTTSNKHLNVGVGKTYMEMLNYAFYHLFDLPPYAQENVNKTLRLC